MDLKFASEKLTVEDSMEVVTSLFIEKGWSDGLPVIPPTEQAVAKMLTGTKRDPADLVATIPPSWGEATVEKIAINAVMAGCLPEYMPVIITAVEAMSEEKFRLAEIQPTTHPVAPLIIVNGPIAKKLNINSKSGAFGPCWRANATIGRTIRLILLNLGGAFPVSLTCLPRVNRANLPIALLRTKRAAHGSLCMWRKGSVPRQVQLLLWRRKILTTLTSTLPLPVRRC